MKVKERKTMSVIITLSCDSKCRLCSIDSQPVGTTQELDIEIWKNVLDDFRERGGEEFCVQGGEPLLYKDINKLLLYANEKGLRTHLISNALHLDNEMIDVLSACSTYVLVSLDGPHDNYRSFRGVDGLETAVVNVDKLLKVGIKVHPIQVIHKKNVNDFSWIVDFCLQRRIPVATLSPIEPVGRASELKNFLLSSDELYLFIERFNQLNQSHQGKVRFVTQSLYRPQDEREYIKDEEVNKNFYDRFYFLLNDGSLVLDLDLSNPRQFTVGSVYDLDNLNDTVYSRYKNLLDRASSKGLSVLRSGKAINWSEIVRREVLQSV